MILTLVPWVILGIGVIGVAVIVLRKIPILLKLPAKPETTQTIQSLREKIKIRLKGLRYSSIQPAITMWLEKSLRKFRVVILKIDNIFVGLIGKAREKSQVLSVRSRAWMEQHQLKKIQKLQVLEKLDKAEVLETIQKAKEEVKLQEAQQKSADAKEENAASVPEEKKLIDLIAENPQNVDAYRKLGFLYIELGNKGDAKECFKQVLKLEPSDFEIIKKIKELG